MAYLEQDDKHLIPDLITRKEFNWYRRWGTDKSKTYDDIIPKFLLEDAIQKSGNLRLSSPQQFVENYVNPNTPYKRLLLKWQTGTGKTIGSLSIAMNFIQYYRLEKEMGHTEIGSVFIIGFSERVFKNELLRFPEFGFLTRKERKHLDKLKKIAATGSQAEVGRYQDMVTKIKKRFGNRKGNGFFKFYGYKAFVNRIFVADEDVNINNLSEEGIREALANGKIKYNEELLDQFKNSLIICDEIHNVYNSIEKNNWGVAIQAVLDKEPTCRAVFASATPLNNSPAEIIDLLNLLLPKEERLTRDDFFDNTDQLKPGALEKIAELSKGRISYLRDTNPKYYPRLKNNGVKIPGVDYLRFIRCPMSKFHYKTYKEVYTGTLSQDSQYLVDFALENPEGGLGLYQTSTVKAALNSASDKWKRKYGLSYHQGRIVGEALKYENLKKYSTKYVRMLDEINNVIKNQRGKIFIYHNIVHMSGVLFIEEVLKKNGFVGEFDAANDNTLCVSCGKPKSTHYKSEISGGGTNAVISGGDELGGANINLDSNDDIFALIEKARIRRESQPRDGSGRHRNFVPKSELKKKNNKKKWYYNDKLMLVAKKTADDEYKIHACDIDNSLINGKSYALLGMSALIASIDLKYDIVFEVPHYAPRLLEWLLHIGFIIEKQTVKYTYLRLRDDVVGGSERAICVNLLDGKNAKVPEEKFAELNDKLDNAKIALEEELYASESGKKWQITDPFHHEKLRLSHKIKNIPITNAWLRCYEIITKFNLVPQKTKSFSYFDNASYPGSFILALWHYVDTNTTWLDNLKWRAMSNLSKLEDEYGLFKNYPGNWVMKVGENDGDVLQSGNIKHLRDNYGNSTNLYSSDVENDEVTSMATQELDNYLLNVGQVASGLAVLKKGGSMFVKMFDLLSNQTLALCYLLSERFEEFYFYKPTSSRNESSEKFIICKGYKGFDVKLQNKLLSTLDELAMEPLCKFDAIKPRFISAAWEFAEETVSNQIAAIKSYLANEKSLPSKVRSVANQWVSKMRIKKSKTPMNVTKRYFGGSATKPGKHHGKFRHKYTPARYVIAHSEVDKSQMEHSIEKFNNPDNASGKRFMILIGSKIIKESYDIKAIQNVFIMGRPDNIPTLLQIRGRAVRKNSHKDLPVKSREVNVYIFTSSLPNGKLSYEETKYKEKIESFKIMQNIERVLHENAIDSFSNYHMINRKPSGDIDPLEALPFKPNIAIKYMNEKSVKELNSSTFNIYFAHKEVEMIRSIIKRLFIEISTVWEYNDLFAAVKSDPFEYESEINTKLITEENFIIALQQLAWNDDERYTEPLITKYTGGANRDQVEVLESMLGGGELDSDKLGGDGRRIHAGIYSGGKVYAINHNTAKEYSGGDGRRIHAGVYSGGEITGGDDIDGSTAVHFPNMHIQHHNHPGHIIDKLYDTNDKIITLPGGQDSIIVSVFDDKQYYILFPIDLRNNEPDIDVELPYRVIKQEKTTGININEFVQTKRVDFDYDAKKEIFYRKYLDISIENMENVVCEYGTSFHIKFLEECIEYVFRVWTDPTVELHQYHEFYFKMLYYYDLLSLVVWAYTSKPRLAKDYSAYGTPVKAKDIKLKALDKYEKRKAELEDISPPDNSDLATSGIINLLKSSINKSSNVWIPQEFRQQFNKTLEDSYALFRGKKKKAKKITKVSMKLLPIGHFIDKFPRIFHPERGWNEMPTYVQHETNYIENDTIVGYDEKSKTGVHVRFKIRNPIHNIKKHKDSRMIEKGTVCKSKSKPYLKSIADKLSITIPEKFNVEELCGLIRSKLIRLELKERIKKSKIKYFYFHYEQQMPN